MKTFAIAAAALGMSLAAALQPATAKAEESWPPRKITFVVALGPGARRTAPPVRSHNAFRTNLKHRSP
ncbi:hypothetical protein A33O_06432 [Nitratireductor aquibiodomus RA22]|uniref:Uncharacterized protein n=1 Tax=Nitratireductor aquibiodomus RA22 TaxID=1189611 RepID=I5C2M5_9HYPH|nr:hypothetical protein A33O_06432 [Nitratireductor aquibiodomus RA22]